ncbi:hypothetical protein C9374_004214 [Naegleria lovaniensis]|uniref:Uncharacterized protein n=1 Tax=Naegleria lovaniensis TaxID=51637 RepID=A0AA88GS98_NAELO|nr:uncharacterized protein C9374_004214 [Naegleria lovaniensis]KAG2383543.1 hypothetical protein C9374_004214 [Naegleria lovaniensis]
MNSHQLLRWGGLVICVLLLAGVAMNLHHLLSKWKSKSVAELTSDTITISKIELDELKKYAHSCKVLKHLSIVLIDTGGNVHKQIRTLVGTIHRYHEAELLIYVYGVDLDEPTRNEIYLWKNVEYWDVRELYQATTNIDRPEKINAEYYKPVIFKHSVERLGKYGSFFASPRCNSPLPKDKSLAATKSFDVVLHGATYNSYAYKNLYIPLYECSRAKCAPAHLKDLDPEKFDSLSDDLKQAMHCQDLATITHAISADAPSDSACYIINREDMLLSPSQLPGFPIKSWVAFTPEKDDTGLIKQNDDKRIHIALGVPTTSKGHKNVNENPLFKVFLPSLKETIARKGSPDGDKYVYKLYVAIDRGDPVYDNAENQKLFKNLVMSQMEGYNFHFQIIKVINSHGWVPMLWNTVFQHSIDDGADYFYQLNDDVKFITPGWTGILIERLENNPFRKNFGVTGPTDEGNRSIFTQAFVHRTHHHIFGYFYPYVFKNWYSDDWISLVYRDSNSYFKDPHKPMVRNQQTFGTRYDICDANGRENLHKILQVSKVKIKEYLESTAAP